MWDLRMVDIYLLVSLRFGFWREIGTRFRWFATILAILLYVWVLVDGHLHVHRLCMCWEKPFLSVLKRSKQTSPLSAHALSPS